MPRPLDGEVIVLSVGEGAALMVVCSRACYQASENCGPHSRLGTCGWSRYGLHLVNSYLGVGRPLVWSRTCMQ